MQQPSGARKPETLPASRRQRQQTRLQKSKGSGAGGRCAEQDPLGGTWHCSTDAHADYGRILKLFSSDPWNGQYLYRNNVSQ